LYINQLAGRRELYFPLRFGQGLAYIAIMQDAIIDDKLPLIFSCKGLESNDLPVCHWPLDI
jgi:hypothetical protein